MPTLLIASTNPGKLTEYRSMVADLPITWRTLADVGLAGMDVPETGVTFAGNALIKARAYAAAAGVITLADDSGLMVDALDGSPGIYSARYAPTTAERNAKLLAALENIPAERRSARFVCAIACVTPNGVEIVAEGICEGCIGDAPRGTGGFGYDPLFVLPNGRTVAELSEVEKNRLSHRGQAMAKLAPILPCILH